MIDNLTWDGIQVHASMPASYVRFVKRLWREQTDEFQHTFSPETATERQSVLSDLLASESLATELCRVYKIPVGGKIARALTRQAMSAPELWRFEDRRPKKEKADQFKNLKLAINRVSALLDKDRQDTLAQPRRTKHIPSKKVDACRPIPLAFENMFSEPLVVRHWRLVGPMPPDLTGIRLRISLYQLSQILHAFDKPLAETIEKIDKFRTHLVDDPVLKFIGQIHKGNGAVRHAALLLDGSIDRFAGEFAKFKRKLSRDTLVSAFVRVICPNNKEEVTNYKAINQMCLPRRKLIAN
jgi:hypothetical protein